MTTTSLPAPPPTGLEAAPRPTGVSAGGRIGPIIKYALVLFFLIVVLMPAYVLIVTSFKAGNEIGVTGQWNLPESWTFASWEKAWTALQPAFLRTFQLAVPVAII